MANVEQSILQLFQIRCNRSVHPQSSLDSLSYLNHLDERHHLNCLESGTWTGEESRIGQQ